jgi:hypothetical protein
MLILGPFRSSSDSTGYELFASNWLHHHGFGYHSTISVRGVFVAMPGLNAPAIPNGDIVLPRDKTAASPATPAHEAIHLVGRGSGGEQLFDPDIMDRWGIRNRSRGSILITERIERDCL